MMSTSRPLAALLLLAGCAEQAWCHRVATQEEARKYEDRCLEQAIYKSQHPTGFEGPVNISNEASKCMRELGFYPCR